MKNPMLTGYAVMTIILVFMSVIAIIAFPPLLLLVGGILYALHRDAKRVAGENHRRELAHAAKRRQWGLD